jgi:hypothetical protein
VLIIVLISSSERIVTTLRSSFGGLSPVVGFSCMNSSLISQLKNARRVLTCPWIVALDRGASLVGVYG